MSFDSSHNDSSWSRPGYRSGVSVGVDVGLRQYMLRVYNFMAAGLGLIGLVVMRPWRAVFTSRSQAHP
jgi:FtsH-binding integral membrane protein